MATTPVTDLTTGDRFHHPACGDQPAVVFGKPTRDVQYSWRVSVVFLNPFTGLHQQQWFAATAAVHLVD